MAANRVLRIPAAAHAGIMSNRLSAPLVGSVPFLWNFTKQDPAVSLMNNGNNSGPVNSAISSAPMGQKVCFSVNLSKIRLNGIVSPQELQHVTPAAVYIFVSLVGDNFGVTSPVQLGPCAASGATDAASGGGNPSKEIMELRDNVTLFVGATLSDIVYFEITHVDSRTGEVKCLGFTSITVAHLVAECLGTPQEKNPVVLGTALLQATPKKDIVSVTHCALPGALEAALWLNSGTFFQRGKIANKSTTTVGALCCATPVPEASMTAAIAPVTQQSITDVAAIFQLDAPKMPAELMDRCVVPVRLLGSMVKRSPLSVAQTINLAQASAAAPQYTGAMANLPVLQPKGDYAFAQPTVGHAAPGAVKEHIVQEALRAARTLAGGGAAGAAGAAAVAEPTPADWVVASKAAMATARVQPPLFVATKR
jgi:hypothetical protein